MILISQMDSAHGTTLLWRWSWPGTFDELFSDLDGCGWRGGPVGRINNGPKCYAPSRCCCKAHADYTPECPWGVLVCSPDVVVVCSPEKHGRLKGGGALGRQTTNVRWRAQAVNVMQLTAQRRASLIGRECGRAGPCAPS